MADVHDKQARSYNMSRIKSKNTKPEILVRKFLHANGFRFRLHIKDLPGKPDIVLPKYKTVIFINGCFWHGHQNCKYFTIPKTRTEWWAKKIQRNRDLDIINIRKLEKEKWNVISVFQCKLNKDKFEKTIQKIILKIKLNAND